MFKKVIIRTIICSFYLSLHAMDNNPKPTPLVSWGLADRIGHRETMEDAYTANTDLIPNSNHSFFGIYDGHGGAAVAEYVSNHLHTNLAQLISLNKTLSDQELLHTAFLETDKQLYGKNNRNIEKNLNKGSTAVVAWLTNNQKVHVGWLGDARAVIVDEHAKVTWASQDHKPNNETERKRIESQHGKVEFVDGAWRLGKKDKHATLAVARAFGDIEFKNGPGNNQVSNEPDTTTHDISPDHFLILACDGVWDVVTNEDAAKIVHKIIHDKNNKPQTTSTLNEMCETAGNSETLKHAAQALRDHAFKNGSTDNISVMVIKVSDNLKQNKSTVAVPLQSRQNSLWHTVKTRIHNLSSFSKGMLSIGAICCTAGVLKLMYTKIK